MDKKLVLELTNHNVYYIKTNIILNYNIMRNCYVTHKVYKVEWGIN